MKYLSLFSGIGGFEHAIKRVFGDEDVKCIGYSEIKKESIEVYEHHYPSHTNLGDITLITEEVLKDVICENGGCDLVVGGFPCTDLTNISNMSGGKIGGGLKGKYSSLLFEFIRLIKVVLSVCPRASFIIENNSSMTTANREVITDALEDMYNGNVYVVSLNNASFGVQTRKRLFWSNFVITSSFDEVECKQKWNDVLVPIEGIKPLLVSKSWITRLNSPIKAGKLTMTEVLRPSTDNPSWFYMCKDYVSGRSRLSGSFVSDTCGEHNSDIPSYPIGKSRPVIGINNILLDRRKDDGDDSNNTFYIRHLSMLELERLMMLPDNYTSMLKSNTKREKVLGNSVAIGTVVHVLECFKEHQQLNSLYY